MRTYSPSLVSFVCGIVPLALISVGCDKLPGMGKKEPSERVTPVASAKPAPPQIDYATVRPNELGRIPVIMYHEIGGKMPTSAAAKPLWRSTTDFRGDLEALHKAGFYPVNLGDVVTGNVDVPAGKSPVALTFDDARESQFKLIEEASAMRVDPNCAMGVMKEFNAAHKDEWPLRATFFILPKSPVTMDSFRQVGMGNQKLAYIVEQGMEIGNHTTRHKSMRPMSAEKIQEELGFANKAIVAAVPNYKTRVFALPMGQYPNSKSNAAYLLKGSFQGSSYDHKAIFLAAYRPIPSPFGKEYDPLRLERINGMDGRFGVRWWVDDMKKAGGVYPRFVSDGDAKTVSFPKSEANAANVKRIAAMGLLPNPYGDASGAGGGAKPIVGAGDSPAPAAGSAGAASESSTAAKPITP